MVNDITQDVQEIGSKTARFQIAMTAARKTLKTYNINSCSQTTLCRFLIFILFISQLSYSKLTKLSKIGTHRSVIFGSQVTSRPEITNKVCEPDLSPLDSRHVLHKCHKLYCMSKYDVAALGKIKWSGTSKAIAALSLSITSDSIDNVRLSLLAMPGQARRACRNSALLIRDKLLACNAC